MRQTPETIEVLSAIDQIKGHKIFNRSPLMRAFLSYVTLETIQGRESRISAYSVAVDALGKPIDFDPQVDPSVRVLAKRLRDSLARYYDEASDYTLCVVLKPGSYVPSFHRAQLAPQPAVLNASKNASKSASKHIDDTIEDAVTATSIESWRSPVVIFRTDGTS